MFTNRHIFSWLGIVMLMLLCPMANAQTLSEDATVSLLSCTPGKPLYFHYGHSALRIQDPAYTAPHGEVFPIDWTFNYGIFSFKTNNFYLKFVKGETDYMLGLEYTSDFQLSCAYEDRTIYYQPLLLDSLQKQTVLDALLENYQPENRYYRYNFVYDNCATRPWRIIRKATGYPEAEGMSGRSWRENIDYYSGRWSWGKFGINLLFGYGADEEMTLEQSLFLPENLMNYVSEQGMTEDEYIGRFTPRDGSFLSSPELAVLVLLLLIAALTAFDFFKGRFTWGFDLALMLVYFAAGLIIFFLYFFSTHPFVNTNLNILYLNPLWIVPIALCCFGKGREWLKKGAPLMLLWLVVALMWIMLKHQTLHLALTLVFFHMCRLAFLGKKTFQKN